MTHQAPTTDPAERLGPLLRDVSRLLRVAVDRGLEPHGLSQAQWRPLIALRLSGRPLTQIELARLLDIEAPTLVRLLDRLGDKGWIERRASADDRRVRHVVLTDQSRGLTAEIDQVFASVKREAFGHLSLEQLKDCADMLESIADRLRASDEPAQPA